MTPRLKRIVELLPVSDELFDGKEYTLQVKEQLRSDTKYYTKRHIRLYSLSEPYYQYLLSLQNIENEGIMGGLTNVGLAEPVRIYSNVELSLIHI